MTEASGNRSQVLRTYHSDISELIRLGRKASTLPIEAPTGRIQERVQAYMAEAAAIQDPFQWYPVGLQGFPEPEPGFLAPRLVPLEDFFPLHLANSMGEATWELWASQDIWDLFGVRRMQKVGRDLLDMAHTRYEGLFLPRDVLARLAAASLTLSPIERFGLWGFLEDARAALFESADQRDLFLETHANLRRGLHEDIGWWQSPIFPTGLVLKVSEFAVDLIARQAAWHLDLRSAWSGRRRPRDVGWPKPTLHALLEAVSPQVPQIGHHEQPTLDFLDLFPQIRAKPAPGATGGGSSGPWPLDAPPPHQAHTASPSELQQDATPESPRTTLPDQVEPLEWCPSDPSFEVPEWLALDKAALTPSEASRHFLVTGETGSGKTKSAILPMLRATLRYPGKNAGPDSILKPSMLVIDPKRELLRAIQEEDRRLSLDREILDVAAVEGGYRFDFFEGSNLSDLDAAGLLQRLISVGERAARSRMATPHGNSLFFDTQAEGVAKALLSVDIELFRRGGRQLLEGFWTQVCNSLMRHALTDRPHSVGSENYVGLHQLFLRLAAANQNAICTLYLQIAGSAEWQLSRNLLMPVNQLQQMPEETFAGIIGTVTNLYLDVATPEVARHVNLNPFWCDLDGRTISIAGVLNGGGIVCYTPRDGSVTSTLIGRALKAKFFELAFRRTARERPFVYVCDEFQRFITNDPISGEQSFLDRCRAYRGICVLATQSMASLEYALAGDGSTPADAASLDVLVNNTGNKLFFRNTDQRTVRLLADLIPQPTVPGRPHLIAVRPPPTLKAGECYFLMSDGAWGRRQVALG